jgi:hypothetical protein
MTTMPNVLLIGAAKSGPSSLYEYLRQHPQIYVPERPGPSFFALEGEEPTLAGPKAWVANRRWVTERRYVSDLPRYQALFRKARDEIAVGESSDLYLSTPEAAERIRHHIPDVKLMAMLRNPVERAYSAYRYLVQGGYETLPTFEEALDAEESRVAANWDHEWQYARRGFYHEQLRRYFDLFDREQIRVFLYDDFAADPAAVLREVFAFLGVDPAFTPDTSVRYNITGTPRSRLVHAMVARPSVARDLLRPFVPTTLRRRVRTAVMRRNLVSDKVKMKQETRRRLVELYREDVLQLQGLIGRDLSHWLRQASAVGR